jgi:hypothetical protein
MNDSQNLANQARYCIWRSVLWGRDYGSYDTIDSDAEAGKLIPGTMPDAYWREGDSWRKQSEVELLIKRCKPFT